MSGLFLIVKLCIFSRITAVSAILRTMPKPSDRSGWQTVYGILPTGRSCLHGNPMRAVGISPRLCGFQCAIVPPFDKSGVHRLPGAIRLRQFSPLCSAAGNPKHPIEHFSIFFPRTAPLPCPFWRKYPFHAFPLFFCQFIPFHVPIFALTHDLCNIYFSSKP